MAFGDQKPEGGNKGAEGILTQIKGLLNQYQALGTETPLFRESQAFETDIDSALDRLKGEQAAEPAREPDDSSPSDFRGATRAAQSAARDGSLFGDRGETKASDDEVQSPEDDDKKKRSKAF